MSLGFLLCTWDAIMLFYTAQLHNAILCNIILPYNGMLYLLFYSLLYYAVLCSDMLCTVIYILIN